MLKKILFHSMLSKLILLSAVLFSSCYTTVIVEDVRGSYLEKLNTEANKDNLLIIDSRSKSEYSKQHLPNAINIPLEEISERTEEFSDWKNKPLYVYASNDDESFKACEILVAHGCEEVYNAEGIQQYNYRTVNFNFVRGVSFAKMLKDKEAIIVDCRLKSDYDLGHLKGAISIPMTEVKNNLHRLPKNKKLLFYCNVGTAAARVSEELNRLGYTDIYCSIDGVMEYNFELTTTAKKNRLKPF